MIDALSTILDGPLAYLRDQLFPMEEAGAEALPVAALLEDGRLGPMLERFRGLYEGADRRAVLSMWSQWYFGMLLPPVTGAILLQGADLPLGLGEVRLLLAGEGYPKALYLHAPGLRRSGPAGPGSPEQGLFRLVEEHLVPFVAAFSARTGTPPRLLWSNAGGRIADTLQAAGGNPAGPTGTATLLDALFNREEGPDGRRNPLFRTVLHSRDGAGALRCRQRVCCLAYRLPGYSRCGGCPLPKVEENSC